MTDQEHTRGPILSQITAKLPAAKTIQGKYVHLRPVAPKKDAAPLYNESHGTPDHHTIWTYMGYGPFSDESDLQRWLLEQSGRKDPLFFTVVENETFTPLGMVSYLNIFPGFRRLEIGHVWYGLKAQRTKVNTETVYLLLREAFDNLGYRRIEWKCDSLNARSRAAALRLGFQYEGLFRNHMIIKKRSRDTTWYAMLVENWDLIKRNIETWLYNNPGNLSLTDLNKEKSRR